MALLNWRHIYLIVIFGSLSIGLIACQKKLDEKNLTTKQYSVLKTANKYKKVYNDHNKSEMKEMISEDAKLLIGTGSDKRHVSRSKYVSMFPKRWDEYPKFRNTFYKIKMLEDNEAKVKTYISINGNRINIDWLFNKEDGRWLLAGYDY